ncbi:tumor protein p63-regulated gene 1 protein [Latimeria chalumnae]|uniref:Tumor protein p63 regulated 1 n=1 Tax=Latimeria chalumnae TaxID=7897 RepID=H3AY87_LATCH|nr:PREDICTED: tumor protein p63-regulated gene 1 protein [Latimeria chalumnae]|eukprot:XP_005992518.1 PREDICTED: tumor protein p63-regulated gene 1 protein [Latimeria chalumnae]
MSEPEKHGEFKVVELKEYSEAKPEKLEPEETRAGPEPEPCLKNTLTLEVKTPSVTTEETHFPKPCLDQYQLRKFFVLRPGAFEQAFEDLKLVVNQKELGSIRSYWLLAEVDHWNNEKERFVVITEQCLLICKYDFMMLSCQQIQQVPLNYIDRICHGDFTLPANSLSRRQGKGLRIHWDKLREASFLSRWNPWSDDLPYTTFTEHPVKDISEKFSKVCQLEDFKTQLVQAVQEAYKKNPVPGRANGVLVLNQSILVETYLGLGSFIGNRNKLGYSLARGNVGF